MKNLQIIAMMLTLLPLLMHAQQDTVIYDSEAGNYIFQYLRENVETGERDSLVRITFVPATKIDPSVNACVEYIKDSSLYVYHYKITNGANSKQRLRKFILEFGNNLDIIDKSTQKWNGGRYFNAGRPLNKYYWGGNQGLEPKSTKDGFALGSSGLPGIGAAYFQARAGIPSFPYGMPWAMDSIFSELEIFPANHVMRHTVVPVPVPTPFMQSRFLDTLSSFTIQSRTLGWIKDQATADKYWGYINSAKTSLQQNNIASTRTTLQQVLTDANVDNTANLTSEAYALIRYNTEYLLTQLPTAPSTGCNVKLVNSTGTKLTGGALQYYEGSWKDAVNNNDGTFFVNTTPEGAGKTTLSLRMTYEYGTQTKSNVTVGSDTVAFQTINAQIQLQNSNGVLIDTGSVQYYAGAWRNLGTTINGTATKELLPANYSFRMTYAYGSKDKQQDIGTNPMVVFQTVNAAVQLQNSQGVLMPAPSGPVPLGDQGTVQYYSGAWRTFGTTTSGTASKELLPNTYSFRMAYEFVSIDKSQDLSANSIVSFSTVLCTIRVKNAQNQPVDNAMASYYSGAWRQIGNTVNGEITKELLPVNLSFRVQLGTQQKDKQQNLSANTTVEFALP